MEANVKLILDKLRQQLVERASTSGVHKLARLLLRYDSVGSRLLDRYDIEDCLRDFGIQLRSEDLQILLANYENRASAKINIDLFLRDIKVISNFKICLQI